MQLQEDILFDDRYLLKKLLGCGGFSEVWLVEDTKVGNKRMALKVYAPGTGLDEDGVQLFSSEFELVFDLNHTHLLRPAYFDVCERSPYLLMPFCEQGSANKLVGNITEEEAWRFLHDVASGLAYLHAQEPPIIHQDIKPDNVLQDHLGNYQITDFGISTKVRSTLRKSMMSGAKSGGTMAYMPPERFGKDNMPIKASDIWAMGATLFELLSGDMPFGEHGGLMQKSGAEIPNIPGQWSKELQEIIVRCLHKDPWNRPVAQQVTEWADKHFKGEKIVMESLKRKRTSSFSSSSAASSSASSKKRWIIAGVLGAGLIAAAVFIVMYVNRSSADSPTEFMQSMIEEPVAEIIYEEESDYDDDITTAEILPDEPEPPSQTAVTPAQAATPAGPPAWLAEYDRILNTAQTAFESREYAKAKEEYGRALNLATRNNDKQKITFATGQIAACDQAIEAAAAASQKEIQDRLATYNFVGNFRLGANMIVQQKSNNRWGIINQEGNVVEEFNYNQVSSRLKNDCYALQNANGWVVFDTSLNKVATNLEKLDDYR